MLQEHIINLTKSKRAFVEKVAFQKIIVKPTNISAKETDNV